MPRVFLLSPASSSGLRAQMLLRPEARFDLARRVQSNEGAPIAEVFAFLSALYFRGKLTYAAQFAQPPAGAPGAWIITTRAGLVPIDHRITADDLRAFDEVDLASSDPRYVDPLQRTARAVRRQLGTKTEVVLLGSVASSKYVEVLLPIFKDNLLFPPDFVGRGDMSRGGVMLRAARAKKELPYAKVAGAVVRGPRAAKLTKTSFR